MLAGLIKNVAFILYLFKIGIIIVKHSSNPSSNVKTNLGLLINILLFIKCIAWSKLIMSYFEINF